MLKNQSGRNRRSYALASASVVILLLFSLVLVFAPFVGSAGGIKQLFSDLTKELSSCFSRDKIVSPLDGEIISGYGRRKIGQSLGENILTGEGEEFHVGIDISAREGESVRAIGDGIAVTADYSDILGNYIIIDHGTFSSLYAHLSAVFVSENTAVSAGDVIAKAGGSGLADRIFLHFEILVDGIPVDPCGYIGDIAVWEE